MGEPAELGESEEELKETDGSEPEEPTEHSELPEAELEDSEDPRTEPLVLANTCTIYKLKDGGCGQTVIPCAVVATALEFESGLFVGTCAEHGYTREVGTKTLEYPGKEVVITIYKKGVEPAELNESEEELKETDGSELEDSEEEPEDSDEPANDEAIAPEEDHFFLHCH